MDPQTLLLGTRKGLIVFEKPAGNQKWALSACHFQGIPVTYAVADHRNGAWWALLDHGHWGVKLHCSQDRGKTWAEMEAPKFDEGEEISEGKPAVVKYLWVLQPGLAQNPGRLFMGTVPGGLFRSEDYGKTWSLIRGLWDQPSRKEGKWFGGGFDQPGIHSMILDPQDPAHYYVAISCAGVFETQDDGLTWKTVNKGLSADFLPDPEAEIGQDPHILMGLPGNPQFQWQQNHCGIYRSVDAAKNWQKVSQGIANFGFAIAVDPDNPETAWVVPAVSDDKRVAVNQALCVCRTQDGGETWQELRNGLPQSGVFDLALRHALDISGPTLCFGTTTGNAYLSNDKGDNWMPIGNNLPPVYSVRFA